MHVNHPFDRYSRQVILKEFGEAAQTKLLQSRVLVVGAGGLGCAALQYLAAAGVGTLGLIDDDVVALHNLHRQVLYGMNDIGLPKAEQAAIVLRQLNPSIVIEAFAEQLTVQNALSLFDNYDIIIDGTDNFATRYLVNDACVLMNKTLVYGAVSRYEGQVTVFNYSNHTSERTANYRDLFPEPPQPGEIANCAEAGVLGVLPGIIGTMQASETIKIITGIGDPLVNRLLTYNLLNNQVFEIAYNTQPNSAGKAPTDAESFEKMNYDWFCGNVFNESEINVEQFEQLRARKDVTIIDVREYNEQPLVNDFPHITVPLGKLNELLDTVEANTIILFCQSGARSAKGVQLLTSKFGNKKNILSLAGGILEWKAALQLKNT